MKRLLLILIFLGVDFGQLKAQSFYHDSATNRFVAEIYLTDSASEIYGQHLKMHVQLTNDAGDSVGGATFTVYMFSVKKLNPPVVFSSTASIAGAFYNAWDANDDRQLYTMMQAGLAGQNIYITFK